MPSARRTTITATVIVALIGGPTAILTATGQQLAALAWFITTVGVFASGPPRPLRRAAAALQRKRRDVQADDD